MDRAGAEATERRLRAAARGFRDPDTGGAADTGVALSCLCGLTVTELDVLGAVVTLMTPGTDPTGPPSQAVAGASDEASHALEQVQFTLGEGPGPDAYATGRPVLVPDLEAAYARWPAYVPSALKAGLGSAYAFPLQLGAVRFGTLTAYAAAPRALGADGVTTCLILADLGTELLLESTAVGGDSLEAGLDAALRFRSEVYQAQGKVAVLLGVSLVHALMLMRARAFATDRDLADLAIGILDGTIEIGKPDD